MKTAMIARFVLGAGAIFAVAGLAGCGAGEQGSGESGAIGSTSEALTSDGTTAFVPNLTAGKERVFAASCKIVDDTTHVEKLLITGGFSSAPAVLSDILAYTPGSPGSWEYPTGAGKVLATARGFHKMIQIPGDSHACLVIGGSNARTSGTSIASAEVVTLHNGTWAVSTSYTFPGKTSVSLANPTARAKFQVSTCSSGNKIVVFGGESATGTALGTNTIQVFDPANASTAWSAPDSLGENRFDFGLAKDSAENFILSGGDNGGGDIVSTELFKNLCVANEAKAFYDSLSAFPLTNGRRGNVVIPERNTSGHFYVTAGANSVPALPVNTEEFTVSWTTPSITAYANNASQIVGAHLPVLVDTGSASVLIGGDDQLAQAAGRDTIASVQERTTSWATPATLANARVGAVAEYMADGKIYVATGVSVSNNAETFLGTGERITP